jgi:hypothetical protein
VIALSDGIPARRSGLGARGATFLALAIAIGLVATASAGTQTQRVAVFFLHGEQLGRTTRPGSAPVDAVRQLLAGPTRTEARAGFRTYIPTGTPLRRLTVSHGLATVDLGKRFLAARTRPSLLARLSQLVRTLTAPQTATRVQLLVEGQRVSGIFPGIDTTKPVSWAYLSRPNVPVPQPPPERLKPPDPRVKAAQLRLIALGYLLKGDADGRFGPVTGNALLAFEKWERLPRTGLLDSATDARLTTAVRPEPVSAGGSGRRAEILLDRQITLLIENNAVMRTIAVSTGKPSTPTPPGNYKVYAKIPKWWSTPFREWLPLALPFSGGIAFHQYLVVPAYAASHGCVRQLPSVARWTYDFASVGMPVKVIARS